MKKRLLVVLGLGLAIFAVGSALYRYRPQVLYSDQSPIKLKEPAATIESVKVPNWVLARGQQLIYDLDYSGRGLFPGPKDQRLDFRFVGQLEILVLADEAGFYLAHLRIIPDQLSQLKTVPPAMRQVLERTWLRGIGAHLKNRGFYLEPQLDRENDPLVKEFWLRLAERLRVDIPETLGQGHWEQQETMAGGSLTSRYELDLTQLSGDQQNQKIHMHKTFEGTLKAQSRISGESLVLFRPHFEGPEKIELQSRDSQVLQGQTWASESQLKLQWQKQNFLNENRLVSLEAEWNKVQPSVKGSSGEISIQKVALGSMSLDDLWLMVGQADPQRSQDLYLKLKAWIYLHPEDLTLLMDRLRPLNDEDPALKLSIRALAGVGHEQAQAMLVDLLDQRKAHIPLARKIVTTLGLLPEPSERSQSSLEALSQDKEDSALRRSSRLALGIMGQRLSQQDNPEAVARADAIETQALETLRKAQGLAAVTEALAVVGNCGLSRIADLQSWLKDPDPAVRGPAFFALRLARPIETSQFLVDHYKTESAAEVKRQMLQALMLRTPDDRWFESIAQLLREPLADADKIALAKTLLATAKTRRRESLQILSLLQQQTQDLALRQTLAKYQEIAQKAVF